jgi:hypothetical protein
MADAWIFLQSLESNGELGPLAQVSLAVTTGFRRIRIAGLALRTDLHDFASRDGFDRCYLQQTYPKNGY